MTSGAVQDKVNELGARGEKALDGAKRDANAVASEAKARLQTAADSAAPSLQDAKNHGVDAFGRARDSAASAVDALQGQAADLAQGATDYARDALDTAKSHAQDLAGRASAAAGQIREQLPDADDLREAGKRGSTNLARQVARQPFESLLLAGAVGYLAAWIIHRR